MSINLINDFSKIYSEQIIESTVPGKPAERLATDRDMFNIPKSEQNAARERLLAKAKAKREAMKSEERDPFGRPGGKHGGVGKKGGGYDRAWQAIEKENERIEKGEEPATKKRYKEMRETLDPVGQEDADVNNNGIDNDKSDKYIRRKRRAIGKAISQRNVREGFSNWRQDLSEVIDTINNKEKNDKIVEKNVNNKIKINPNIGEDVQFLESVELSEEYIDQIINLASQYFYSEGYDEDSVNVIAEGMGYDQFVDFIFDIGNTFFLDEAAYQGELLTAKGAARKNPKTSAAKGASTPVSHTPSKPKEDKPEKKKTSPGQLSIDYNKKPTPPGQQRVKDAVGNAVKKATSPEAKKAVGGAVKSAANTAARAALSAWKGHKAAMKKKGEGGSVAQQVGAGLGAAAGAFFKKGKSHLKDSYEFTDWLNYIVSEGCDISEWTINDLYKQYKLNEAIYGQSKKRKKRKEAIQNQETNEEFVSEEDYDRMKDRHLERGGMGARSSTSPSKTTASKPMTDAERKAAIEKQRQAAQRAFELVRNQVIAKYGKNAVK